MAHRIVANDGAALAASAPQVFEETIATTDGERIKLSTKGALRDITESRSAERAERALRDSEDHDRSVAAALDEGVFVIDRTGRILSSNRAAERISGGAPMNWQGPSAIAHGWQVLDTDGLPARLRGDPTGL